MLFPSLEEVKRLALEHTDIPVFFEFPADHKTPISIYTALAEGEENAFLLESVNNGTQWDRYSFIGFHPAQEVRAEGCQLHMTEHGKTETMTEPNPFRKLQSILDQRTSPKFEDMPYFTGGMIGYFAYDAVRYTEKKLCHVPEDDIHMPDIHLFRYDELVAYDHLNSNAIIIINLHADGNLEKQYQQAEKRAADIAAKIEDGSCSGQSYYDKSEIRVVSNVTKEEYMSMVDHAKQQIRAGEIFQVVLSQRFAIDNPPDSFEVYRRLRATNPSPYLYYFKTKEYEISGASPELLVKVNDGIASTKPIAGTRPRGKTHAEDKALEASLIADEKEKAEHTMLVDLGRNDLGRVSEYGSVEVTDFMYVERYSTVMHLVSDVRGKLRKTEQKKMMVLNSEECGRLERYLINNTSRTNTAVLLCMFTGLRVGELCGLKWEDIDLERNTVSVNRTVQRVNRSGSSEVVVGSPKSRSSVRTIPIPDFLSEILAKQKGTADSYLITGTGKPTEPRTMQNRFRAILKDCGVRKVNFHMIRHTYATVCVEHGFDPKTLSELLGHADASIALNRYVHSSMQLKRDYVSRLKLTA